MGTRKVEGWVETAWADNWSTMENWSRGGETRAISDTTSTLFLSKRMYGVGLHTSAAIRQSGTARPPVRFDRRVKSTTRRCQALKFEYAAALLRVWCHPRVL